MNKGIVTLIACLLSLPLSAQNYYMASPEGYGAATTGGGNAAPVIVSNYTEFKAKLLDAATPVILVSGTITVPDGGSVSAIVNNKSILGLPGARLVNTTKTQSGSGILYLKNGSSNVIIRNLIFEGPGAFDVDGRDNLTADGCINLWVDHCEFQDAIDGNFDIKGNSDNVTVSWCKFTYLKPPTADGSGGSNDHRFSDLIGSGSSDAPVDKHFSVTFQNCYWADGCRERMPRARNAQLHILNCYYQTNVTSSVAIGLGGGVNNLSCYVENSHFASIGTVYKNYNSSDGGSVDIRFVGCLNGVASQGNAPAPAYSYTALPVADVTTFIPNGDCGAGATLQVTPAAAISSPCAATATQDAGNAFDIKFYPAILEESLFIDLPDTNGFGPIHVAIFSSNGQLVYSQANLTAVQGRIEVSVGKLPKGAYFCRLQNERFTRTQKIIKG